MHWFLIALGAPFLWGLANMTDKYLVHNYVRHSPGALVLYSSLVGWVVAFLIAIFGADYLTLTNSNIFLLILVGALGVLSIIFYFFAVAIEDISSIALWMLTIPVFGYIVSYFLLGENLTPRQILGAVIILVGAAILSIDFREVKLIFKGKVAMWMILSCLLYAFNGAVFKFAAEKSNFWGASFWEYLGLGLGGVIVFLFTPTYRSDFLTNIRNHGLRLIFLNMRNEATTIAGNLLTNFALLLAPVAMVYLVGTFQPIIVLFYAFVSTKFFPHIVEESFSKVVLAPKIVATAIMIVGSAILFT